MSSGLRIEVLPDGDLVLSGRAAVVPAKARWLSGPSPDIGATLQELDWQAGVHVPLSWGEQVLGVMAVFLPPTVMGPTEAELAFLVALADQGAVAVINDRLLTETGQASALQERARLARELHDSVSQALFSMTLHARTAQLAMEKQRPAARRATRAKRRPAAQAYFSQRALAEMRALIFELRPDALAEEGLIAALRKQAAALSSRTGLRVAVEGPEQRLDVTPATEEHHYRLALEALNNTVKHADARPPPSRSPSLASDSNSLSTTTGSAFTLTVSTLGISDCARCKSAQARSVERSRSTAKPAKERSCGW